MANIYKRGTTWWARAQRKGEEYRRSLKTGNRSVALKRLRVWLDQLEAASWGDRPRISFADAVRGFIAEHLPTLKPSAARRYGVSLKWLTDKYGDAVMDEIGREELSGFESWRRALGVSNPTIRRDLMCLSAVFTFCEDKGWRDDGTNPVPGYLKRRKKKGLTESPPRERYLTEDEEARLLAVASPLQCEAIILSIDTGLRRGELLSLTWAQVDFVKGVIRTTVDTKGRRSRLAPLPPRSAALLAQKRAQRLQSFFVFPGRDDANKPTATLQNGFKAAVQRAGLPETDWHDLRRTAGCRWLQRDGMSMEQVAQLLGHKSVTTTEKHYAFLDEETAAREAGRTKPGTSASGPEKRRNVE